MEKAQGFKKCPQCPETFESCMAVKKTIFMRGRNRMTGKAESQAHKMEFCSAKCGSHYQMGCEG